MNIIKMIKEIFPKRIYNELYKKMKPFDNIKEIIYITSLKHTNIGDHIIYLAEKNFFNKKGIKIRAEFNDNKFFEEKFKKVISNLPIVVRGGGYFGDTWYQDYKILEKIVKRFKSNKIIFMPQSIFFKDKQKLKRTIKIFNKHKDITIFARDSISYKIVRKYFKKNSIYFSPDSAFFLVDSLKPSNKIYFSKKFRTTGILYLNRDDREKILNWIPNKKDIIILDWIKLDLLSLIRPNSERLVKMAVDLFYNKKLIITSRLHGAILASLLRKRYILIANSYHKIESFYDSWLKNDPNAHLVKSEVEIKRLISKYF